VDKLSGVIRLAVVLYNPRRRKKSSFSVYYLCEKFIDIENIMT
jgi:hypothetical protein